MAKKRIITSVDLTTPPMDCVFIHPSIQYSPSTGMIWKIQDSLRIKQTAIGNHYHLIYINSKQIAAHRAIWNHFHGKIKAGMVIDHINGTPSDNRLENLQQITHAQNHQKRGVMPNNTSGFPGIRWRSGKWDSVISNKGKLIHLGRFTDKLQAYRIFLRAKIRLHGEASIRLLPKLISKA